MAYNVSCKSFYPCLLLVLLVCFSPATQASSIYLQTSDPVVLVGHSVTLEVYTGFADEPTLAGGVDIFYAYSILDFISFVFNPLLATSFEPYWILPSDDLTEEINAIGFGSATGLSGQFHVGSIIFQVIASGLSTISMASNDGPVGGFTSTDRDAMFIYYGSNVVVKTVIPLPTVA